MNTPQQQFSAKLRAVAQWYDEHPNAPCDDCGNPLEFPIYRFSASADELRAIGPGRKFYSDNWFDYKVEGDGFLLSFVERRENVCVRKVVGRKIVPEIVLPAREEIVIAAHEEEIVEWECPGSLLAETAVSA